MWTARADHYYAKNNYQLAAMYYANTQKPFEEITLKFIQKNEQDALKTYLLSRLENMKRLNSQVKFELVFCFFFFKKDIFLGFNTIYIDLYMANRTVSR